LQGEGQEFESPRLHHHSLPGRASECLGAPLIGALLQRATDQRIAGVVLRPEPRHLGGARTLPTGIVIGRKRSQDLRFRRVVRNSDIPIPSARDRWVRTLRGSSYKGHGVDALAPRADEGRGRLRKASGSREQTLIRRCPNGETRLGSCPVTPG
jgi:hypothetical protein